MDIGINLSPVNDYNREWVFSNIFAQSREWRLIRNGVAQPPTFKVPVSENGYPDFAQIAPADGVQSLMLIDHAGHYPKGIYKASWSGDSVGVVFKGQGLSVSTPVKGTDGYWTADLDLQGNTGFALELRKANIDDMTILMPGHNSQVFHPTFRNPLNTFKFIRFLNWMNTNACRKPHTWSERTTVLGPRQSYQPQGVALEVILFLSNQTKAAPWFCMPHLFDDDYVRRFAKMTKKMCKSEKIYVEFSNETWNSDFPVHAWAKAEAAKLGIIWPYVVADAAKHMWDIWQEVFFDQPTRLVRVLGAQMANPWVATKQLERLSNNVDLLAVASYFGVPKGVGTGFNASTTPMQILNAAKTMLPVLLDNLKKHTALGRPVAIYEGGQHIIGEADWFQAAYDAQILPEMYDATYQNLAQAKAAGVTHFGAFTYVSERENQYGSWGHLEGQEQVLLNNNALRQQAPKAAALRSFLGL